MDPDPWWAPYQHTPRVYANTDGDAVSDFVSLMTVSKGFKAGHRLAFAAWQEWLARWLLERKDNGMLRYRQAVIGLPRKTGKSLLGSSIALYYLVGDPDLGREIYSVAGDRQQARLVFGEARWQAMRSKFMSKELKIYRDAIEHPESGSVYRVLSHDGRLAQGLNPFIAIMDEAHVYKNRDLWDAMTQGSGARPESLTVAITTAGAARDSLLGELCDYGTLVADGEKPDPSFGYAWWQAPPGRPVEDEVTWRQANPNITLGLTDLDEMRQNVMQTPEHVFRRYRLNQWVPLGGLGWMDMTAWRGAADKEREVPKGTEIVLGFDGSLRRDATALVAMTTASSKDERPHMWVVGCWEPPHNAPDDWLVPRDEVDAALTGVFEDYDVRCLQMDISRWEEERVRWAERFGKKRVLDFTMSDARMIPACLEFYKGIVAGQVTHSDDVRMNRHMGNAVIKSTYRGDTIRKIERGSLHLIDLAVAACIANDARLRTTAKPHYRTVGF